MLSKFLVLAFSISICAPVVSARAQTLEPRYWAPNGPVRATTVLGSHLYVGGAFSYVGPATGHAALFDAGTGEVNLAFPRANGAVRDAVTDGTGGWYLAGDFTAIGGEAIRYLAHVRADFSVDTVWNPAPNAPVWALELWQGFLVAGGDFTEIGGAARNRLAGLSPLTGALKAWNPGVNGRVRAIATTADTLYIGGEFTEVAGMSRERLAAFDTNGNLLPWNPIAGPGAIRSIVPTPTAVYVGGAFFTMNGVARNHAAALDPTSGALLAWNPSLNGQVYAMVSHGSRVYLAGIFSFAGGATRYGLAAVNSQTGALDASWNGGLNRNACFSLTLDSDRLYAGGRFESAGGTPCFNLAALNPETGASLAWNATAGDDVEFLGSAGNTVLAGGNFSSAGGVRRNNLAALDLETGAATSWAPNPGASVNAMTITPQNTLIVAGGFRTISGASRDRVAEFNSSGALTSFRPNGILNDSVYAVVSSSSTVYVGGTFTDVDTGRRRQIRLGAAAFSRSNGGLTSWAPDAQIGSAVWSLAISGNTIYAGGNFTTFGGQPRNRLAAVDGSRGNATAWNPNADGEVTTISVVGNALYAGGRFLSVGGEPRTRLAKVNLASGAVMNDWMLSANGAALSIAPSSRGTILLGGEFTAINGIPRFYAAETDIFGNVTSWNPSLRGGNPSRDGGFARGFIWSIQSPNSLFPDFLGGEFRDLLGGAGTSYLAGLR